MRVMVTGANGFIGRQIVSNLVADGFDVAGLSKTGGANKQDSNIVQVDITDRDSLLDKFRNANFDAFIHSAGLAHQFGRIDESEFEKVNVRGTGNVAELAHSVKAKRFILLSSTAVYGPQSRPADETSICRPETPYAVSKLKAEALCREICGRNKMPLTIFRLAPVLGEKGIGNVPRLIGAIDKRRFIWIGNGENKKSLIYVGDVAEACRHFLRSEKLYEGVYNLASGPIEMRSLVSIISRELGRNVPKLRVPAALPMWVLKLNSKSAKFNIIDKLGATLEKWLSDDIYPAAKISAETGFVPGVSIEEAVAKQCEWFLQTKNKEA